MSTPSGRSAAFLAEMGVGPQWTLRRGLPQTGDAQHDAGARAADASAGDAVDADVAAAHAPEAVAEISAASLTSVSVPPEVAARKAEPPMTQSAPAAAPQSTPAAVPQPAPAAYEPPAADGEDSTAWFDDAPAPPRAEPVSADAIAAMDWPALKAAVAVCTRCDLCATRRSVVPGRGIVDAPWIVIGAGPSRLDEKDKRAISGEAGQLLDNMLKAIGRSTERDVYLTNLVKCRPVDADGADRAPTPDEVAACRPYLERELALTGAAQILTLGQAAAKGMLGAASRGKVHRHGALPVVATYHPDDLLRKPEDKAKAWADLCLARDARDGA